MYEDDEADWATSICLHDDTVDNNPALSGMKLTVTNHAFLASLVGKPIRTTSSNNMRLTFVPELDDTLHQRDNHGDTLQQRTPKKACAIECTCCSKCPYCLQRVRPKNVTLEKRKFFRENSVQTDDLLLPSPPQILGDAERRQQICISVDVYDKMSTTPDVEKSSKRSKKARKQWAHKKRFPNIGTDRLYLRYVIWMCRDAWRSFDPNFQRKYEILLSKHRGFMTDSELARCQKKFGDFTDKDQLRDMLERALLKAENDAQNVEKVVNIAQEIRETLSKRADPIATIDEESASQIWQSANEPNDVPPDSRKVGTTKSNDVTPRESRDSFVVDPVKSRESFVVDPVKSRDKFVVGPVKRSDTFVADVPKKVVNNEQPKRESKKLPVRMTKASKLRAKSIKMKSLPKK